jgi:hypothetical protein
MASDVARPKKPKKAQKRAFDREIERSIGTPARTHRKIVRAWRIVPGSKTESRALLVCDFLTNEICTFFFSSCRFSETVANVLARRTRQQPSDLGRRVNNTVIATKRPADAFRPHTRPPGGCGVT